MDMIARTFDVLLKCTLEKYDGSTLDYNSPVIDEQGRVIISPSDAAAAFTDCAISEDMIPMDTTDGSSRTFNLSLTMNAETTSPETNPIPDIDDIGRIVISIPVEGSRIVSVTKNDLNEIITEEQELDEPYSEEQIVDDLKSLTNNWSVESALKTNYESEYEAAKKILATHYTNVSGEKVSDNEWRVTFNNRIQENVSEPFDRNSVIDRFMKGEMTIDILKRVPPEAVPLEELGIDEKKLQFYYDPESDTVGYITR